MNPEEEQQLRPYVLPSYRFLVELHGLEVAGFSEVSGLESEMETEEVMEGGLNGFVHRLPGRIRHQPLVLKRGITISNDLWEWYYNAVQGNIERMNGSIMMFDEEGYLFRAWSFKEAYPTKWRGPELNAMNSEVAFESIEIVHNGLEISYL